MSTTLEKLFQPDSDGPDLKLEYENRGEYGRVYVRERGASGWETVGVIECHPAIPTDYRGVCEPHGTITSWSYTRFHANGDRVKVSHRLRSTPIDDGVVIRHEVKRRETLGFGDREEHDWRERERWRVTTDGVRYWSESDE